MYTSKPKETRKAASHASDVATSWDMSLNLGNVDEDTGPGAFDWVDSYGDGYDKEPGSDPFVAHGATHPPSQPTIASNKARPPPPRTAATARRVPVDPLPSSTLHHKTAPPVHPRLSHQTAPPAARGVPLRNLRAGARRRYAGDDEGEDFSQEMEAVCGTDDEEERGEVGEEVGDDDDQSGTDVSRYSEERQPRVRFQARQTPLSSPTKETRRTPTSAYVEDGCTFLLLFSGCRN